MKIKHLESLHFTDYFKDGEAICVIKEMRSAPSNAYIAMHDHEFSEVVVVAQGALTHLRASGTMRLTAGDFFAIHPGERHGYADLSKDTVVYNCLYKADRPPPGIYDIPPLRRAAFFPAADAISNEGATGRLAKGQLQAATLLIRALKTEGKSQTGLSRKVEASLFAALLMILADALGSDPEPTETCVRRATVFIEENLHRRVTLRELCAAAGCSPVALNRAFHTATGKSPGEYALHRRLDRAKVLMSIHGLTLAAAAQQTGFFDASHLSHAIHGTGNRNPPQMLGKLSRTASQCHGSHC